MQTLRISIPEPQVKDPEAVVRMQQAILDKIAAIPGVVVGRPSRPIVPMDRRRLARSDLRRGSRSTREAQIPPLRLFKFVSPGLLKTMGNPLVAGRDFTWTDVYDKRPVAMVSENLARELWQRAGGGASASGSART